MGVESVTVDPLMFSMVATALCSKVMLPKLLSVSDPLVLEALDAQI